jgi:hypothetical protein
MTAIVISLADARRLRKAESEPTPELDEELGRLGAEVLRNMALLLLSLPPDSAGKRVVTQRPPPDEAG